MSKVQLAYCFDCLQIIEERGLDRNKLVVRIGFDAGQGCMKISLTVTELDRDNSDLDEDEFSLNGVNAIQLIGRHKCYQLSLIYLIIFDEICRPRPVELLCTFLWFSLQVK